MKTMKKYLIINADDFGYNEQQNTAITELLSKGLITSTSVMAPAPYADRCVELDGTSYSVGVHLTVNSDSADSPWKSLTGADSLGGTDGLPSDGKKLTFGASVEITPARFLKLREAFIRHRNERQPGGQRFAGDLPLAVAHAG